MGTLTPMGEIERDLYGSTTPLGVALRGYSARIVNVIDGDTELRFPSAGDACGWVEAFDLMDKAVIQNEVTRFNEPVVVRVYGMAP